MKLDRGSETLGISQLPLSDISLYFTETHLRPLPFLLNMKSSVTLRLDYMTFMFFWDGHYVRWGDHGAFLPCCVLAKTCTYYRYRLSPNQSLLVIFHAKGRLPIRSVNNHSFTELSYMLSNYVPGPCEWGWVSFDTVTTFLALLQKLLENFYEKLYLFHQKKPETQAVIRALWLNKLQLTFTMTEIMVFWRYT